MVGIECHAIGGFAQGGVGVGHSVTKRVGHPGIVVVEQDCSAVFQTIGEVVLGCNRREDGELVASQSKRRLVHLHIQLEIEAYLQDVAVALVMPKDVVAVLKVIDVDKSHGDGQFLLPELLEGTGKAAAVAKSGKLVGKGGPDQIVLTFKKVADGLFERLGVIADSIHVVSGFLRSGELRRASSLCTRVVVRRFACIQAPPRCVVGLIYRLVFAVDNS